MLAQERPDLQKHDRPWQNILPGAGRSRPRNRDSEGHRQSETGPRAEIHLRATIRSTCLANPESQRPRVCAAPPCGKETALVRRLWFRNWLSLQCILGDTPSTKKNPGKLRAVLLRELVFGTERFKDLQYGFSGAVVLKLAIRFDYRQIFFQRLFVFPLPRQRLSQIKSRFKIVRTSLEGCPQRGFILRCACLEV